MLAYRTIWVTLPVFNHVLRLEHSFTMGAINIFTDVPLVKRITDV
jgi:hypothetical protein